MSAIQSPVGTDKKPAPGEMSGKNRRWLSHATDVAVVLAVCYGVGDFAWVVAHRSMYRPPAVSEIPIDKKLWLFNLPFFLLGLIWLTVRFSQTYAVPYLRFETRHLILKQLAPLAIALGGMMALGTAIAVCSRL
jgi:hypothetical protein